MKLTIKDSFADVARQIKEVGKQAEYAAAVALTRTAQDIRTELKEEMRRSFDRPTPYTMNSLFVKGANKSNIESKVWLKDNPFGKGTSADRYLGPQINGGVRSLKGMERALQATGLMARNDFAIPAAGAQLDSYGNVKRSQIVQILSQLKVQLKAGYESRRSDSAASKRSVRRQGKTYFAIPKAIGGLKPGVYLKIKFGHGSAIKPVFIFTPSARYKPRFKFFDVGLKVATERFPVHFRQEMEKAIRTAMHKQQSSLF